MNCKVLAGATACLILGLATSTTANAAIVTVTYSGAVDSGTDGLGIFGVKGNSLKSLPFTMTYVFDTSINRTAGTSPAYQVSYGGSVLPGNLASPLISAMLTINGVNKSVDGSVFSDIGFWSAFTPGYYETTAGLPGSVGNSGVVMGNFLQSDFSSIDQLFKETNLVGGISFADSGVTKMYSGFFDFLSGSSSTASTDGRFASGVTLDVTSGSGTLLGGTAPGVPEPATWGMMILGFGAIGTMLRRGARARVAYTFA